MWVSGDDRSYPRWISKGKRPTEGDAFREGKSTGSRGGILARIIHKGSDETAETRRETDARSREGGKHT